MTTNEHSELENNFKPGSILMVKSPIVAQYDVKNDRYGNVREKICSLSPYSMLFLAKKPYTVPSPTLSNFKELNKFEVIFDGKFINYALPSDQIDEHLMEVKLPSISSLDPIDQWLTAYHRVHGKVFFVNQISKRGPLKAYRGRYSDYSFPFSGPNSYLADYVTSFKNGEFVIGVAVRRRAAKRSCVFEFMHNDQIYWKEFYNSELKKLVNKSFDMYFKRFRGANKLDTNRSSRYY